jgi:1,4-alpha-glucan branching enzyme
MTRVPALSLVLNLHVPLIRHPRLSQSTEEQWFFETLSETCLPLLAVLDRLDADRVPFRLALSLSPTLCHLLGDETLRERYLEYTTRQLDFGERELGRLSGELGALARFYYDQAVERRFLYLERYGGDLLGVFDRYQKKGRLELLSTAATHAFLPFYVSSPEALQAQIEVALASYRHRFGRAPQGFWLPEMGWTAGLGEYLRAYNFAYTLVEPHALLSGERPARGGAFRPVKTPGGGIFVFGRDFYAGEELARMVRAEVYRDNRADAGYELSPEALGPFLDSRGGRTRTGYKYWSAVPAGQNCGGTDRVPYDPGRAREQAAAHAREFLSGRIAHLAAAGEYLEKPALSLCAWEGDRFGRLWYEGPEFIESLFREGARRKDIHFMTPAEYLYKQDMASIETLMPEFSSWGESGYGEPWLDAANDWMYRHLARALDRMIELAERFPDNTGLKERALNQAAREILLAQASDWPRMLYHQDSSGYARSQVESSLRNFTTIYEALGSSYLSTEWLTALERRHNIFPQINYRVFRRKK